MGSGPESGAFERRGSVIRTSPIVLFFPLILTEPDLDSEMQDVIHAKQAHPFCLTALASTHDPVCVLYQDPCKERCMVLLSCLAGKGFSLPGMEGEVICRAVLSVFVEMPPFFFF